MDAAAATLLPGEVDSGTAAPDSLPITGEVSACFGDAASAAYRLREQWPELEQCASEPNAFVESWFAGASLRHLDVPVDLKTIEVWQGRSLLGLLPVHVADRYGRLKVRHVTNWLHYHSFLGTPLIRKGAEAAFWEAVLRLLDEQPWARGFLHVASLVEDGPVHRGLSQAAARLQRPCDVVYRTQRALLESDLSPGAYYEQTVRKKKRKELKRLSARLAELGRVEFRMLSSAEELEPWTDAFLELERSGWKGDRGSALACDPGTRGFFREAIEGAFHAGKLDFLRMDLDGRPIAMLVNFLSPPGSFSFKIAIDEDYARFSPGVLIQIENLRILERGGIEWMDSCATENHPMINSLWGERRHLVRVSVPLAGPLRQTIFRLCRTAEQASAALRGRRRTAQPEQVSDHD
ncbi:MAG TPA: GNAT family N-acetyltransferase [Allosphingosinicella sp.]|jgi:CelD/BcsL family acetyltransferase involved in cellulose biosynthesis